MGQREAGGLDGLQIGSATIAEFVRGAVGEVPDRVWLISDDGQLTYAQAGERIERVASWLRGAGVGVGERVLVVAGNTPDAVLVWLGLMEVGAIEVPINPKSSGAEIRGFVQQVQPRLVIADSNLLAVVAAEAEASGYRGGVVAVSDLFEAEPDGVPPVAIDAGAVAVMIPTSGTTGRSKLVMQTHRGYVLTGESFPFWTGLTGADRLLTSLPLFHINAQAYSVLGSVGARASLVVLPRFSPGDLLDAARRHDATQFNAIGAMLELLMRQPERGDDRDHPLRLCYAAPSPAPERHVEIEERFGFELVCGYGLSESPFGLIWPRGTRPLGALGVARQHPVLGTINEARVRDPGPDGVGELELRNPTLLRGYYEMPAETAEVLVDGWLRTGDLVTEGLDGNLTFVGRRKEVIRRRGENLSPSEVEAALVSHPDVAEAAVIGVPSPLSEEDVKAYLVAESGAVIDIVGVAAHAAGLLARFKVPRYYEVITELPMTPTGRVAKGRLSKDRTDAEVDLELPR